MKASICLPSNRPWNQSKTSILQALSYISHYDNIELVLCDNANDPEKKAHLLSYSDNANFKYIDTTGTSANENWLLSLKHATGDYLLRMGDDDVLVELPTITPTTSLNIDPNCIGIKPNMVAYDVRKGITNISSFDITNEYAIDRLEKYLNCCDGINSIILSFLKKELLIDISQLIEDAHPLKEALYYDWAMSLAYAASGKIYTQTNLLYVYDTSNWGDNTGKSLGNLFSKSYLSARSAIFLDLLLGIDSFILIMRTNNPITETEKQTAAVYVLIHYMTKFLIRALQQPYHHFYTSTEKSAIYPFLTEESTQPINIFELILNLLTAHEATLGDKYQAFHKHATGKEWGTIANHIDITQAVRQQYLHFYQS